MRTYGTEREIIEWAREEYRKTGRMPGAETLRKRFGFGYKRAVRMREIIAQALSSPGEPTAFLDETGIEPGYSVERVLINKWGVPGAEQRQLKVWLTRTPQERELADRLAERLKEYQPATLWIPEGPDQVLALFSFPDAHVGMLAWGPEAGANYDTKIALQRIKDAFVNLVVGQAAKFPVSKIVIPIGNDILHADTHDNTTTAGTRVDVDSRWQKAFMELAEVLIVEIIGGAAKIAPVHVVVVPGNHDYQRAFYLGEVIRWHFRDRESLFPVSVDNAPRTRKYIRWGSVLLGFTHGAWEKINDLPLIMAQEGPELWGTSTWREWLIGHYHRKKEIAWVPTFEKSGVRIRVLPSMAPADAWHYKQGYIGGAKEATLSIYSPNGLIADFYWR